MEGVIFLVLSVLFGCLCVDIVGASQTYDVTSFGAVGDGRTDDSQYFLSAWVSTCKDASSPTFLIPEGKTFLLNQIIFSGPCQSSVHVLVGGNLVAPSNMWRSVDPNNWISFMHVQDLTIDGSGQMDGQGSSWWDCVRARGCPNAPDFGGNLVAPSNMWRSVDPNNWISFMHVQDLTIDGSGQMDGQGSSWWDCVRARGCPNAPDKCSNAPSALAVYSSNNVRVSDIHIINSPAKHFNIYKCVGASVNGITISSPGLSPNTDGIHIQESQQVQVTGSNIASGDDCISIGEGSSNVSISHIACGPGHGISIGSLGRNGAHDEVQQIHVSFCSFVQTSNGARIKTWQGGSGLARGITFEHLTFDSVKYPVLIDQYYCMSRSCPEQKAAVQVSDVKFVDLTGTTVGDVPVTLNCSRTVGCTGIVLQDVNIRPKRRGGLSSSCINAHGSKNGTILPAVPCLVPDE